MFAHASFSLGLIALVLGTAAFVWSVRAESGRGTVLAKVVGIVVIVLSILTLLCTVFSAMHHGKKYRADYPRKVMMKQQHQPKRMRMDQAPARESAPAPAE